MKRKGLTIAVTLMVLVAAGIAWAAWTATGTGDGTARARSAVALTLVGTSSGTLYPGARLDMDVAITNPNDYPVHIHQVAQNGPITAAPTCSPTGVTFTTSNTSASTPIPANTTATIRAVGALSMDNTSEERCQGATFTIPLMATGESAASPHA
jgi:hypothetical protein